MRSAATIRRASAVVLAALCYGAVANPAPAQAPAAPPSRGQVVYQSDFEGKEPPEGVPARVGLGPGNGGAQALQVERAAGATRRSVLLSVPLPAEPLRGCVLSCSAMVKAEGISARPNPWNGIKFMLAIDSPLGKLWPQGKMPDGTFDWQRISFTVSVPRDAAKAVLHLGLENVTGKVWFDDVKVSVRRVPATVRLTGGPMYKGHNLPRLRGAMVSEKIDEAGLRTLGQQWNANLIRWQLIRHAKAGTTFALAEYDAWLDGELKRLDAALPLCEKYGLRVVIDLHSPPGGKAAAGYSGSNDRLFTDKACQDKLVQVWQLLAKRYRNAQAIWGYDLANEPDDSRVSEDCDVWQDLAERVARAIREIDPERTIIVEAVGSTHGFLSLEPLTVPRVVYSVHMYDPWTFTAQSLRTPGEPVSYPGRIDGQEWNKARLEEALRPVLDFQKAYNAHIFVGEFSAIRWAPGDSARDYLRDVIDIFESYGWDWTYHAFREWHGWSVEHTGDRDDLRPAAQPTDREMLLRQWYAKNQKP